MMKSWLPIIVMAFAFATPQQAISVEEAISFVGQAQGRCEQGLREKGFTESEEITAVAQEFASQASQKLKVRLHGTGFSNSENYSATIIATSSHNVVGFQFGTKIASEIEIEALAKKLSSLGFAKQLDRESASGNARLRAYDRGSIYCTLAAYFSGGYTLSCYSNAVFK